MSENSEPDKRGGEELGECPMCGDTAWSELWNFQKIVIGYKCEACLNEFIGIGNDSYYWKEIDCLAAENRRYREALEKIANDEGMCGAYVCKKAALEALNAGTGGEK